MNDDVKEQVVGAILSEFMDGVDDPVAAFQAVAVAERHAWLALSALRPGDEINGCVLMPTAPTDKMIRAGVEYRLRTTISGDNDWYEDTDRLYRVMMGE